MPSLPFEAVYTWYPSHSRTSLRMVRISTSSSIRRMFLKTSSLFRTQSLPLFHCNVDDSNRAALQDTGRHWPPTDAVTTKRGAMEKHGQIVRNARLSGTAVEDLRVAVGWDRMHDCY